MSSTTLAPVPEQDDTGEILRRWNRTEFYRAAELGLFRDEKLELIHGKVYQKLPMNPLHVLGIRASAQTLAVVFGPAFDIRQQLPIVLATDGEPLPDILIVPGSWEDYVQHPTQTDAVLLVEISDTTLRIDRGEKAALYAEAGIADYWLVNLPQRTLEVRRNPVADVSVSYGFRYDTLTVYSEEQTASPLTLPDALIRVADLLPPVPIVPAAYGS